MKVRNNEAEVMGGTKNEVVGTGPQIITSRLHVTFRSKKCYYVIMYLLQPLAAPPPFPSSVATVSSPSISPSVVVVVVVVVFA